MPIEFHCTRCNQLVRTPDKTAGKKGRCPQCGAIVQIPRASTAAPPPSPAGHDAAQRTGFLELDCPNCQRVLRITAANAGQKGKCPHCSAVIQIPLQSTPRSPSETAGGGQPAAATGADEPIQFQCASCHQLVRTPRITAGRKGRCPHCGAVVQIPAMPAAATRASATPSPPGGGLQDDLFADLPMAGVQNPLEAEPLADWSAPWGVPMATPYSAPRAKQRAKPRKDYGARNGLPWERKHVRGKFFSTTSKVLFSPNLAFSIMRRTGGVGKPLAFVVSGVALGAFLNALYALAAIIIAVLVAAHSAPQAELNAGQVALALGIFAAVFIATAAVASLMLAIAGSFLGAVAHHVVLTLLGAADFGFETTYRVVAYCQGAVGVLLAVPLAGLLITPAAYPVLMILGFCAGHETSAGRASAAVLVPLGLFSALVLFPMCLFVAPRLFEAMMEAVRMAATAG